ISGGALPVGTYRLTVLCTVSGGIHDVSGNLLDGDANGTPGGNYIRTFTISIPSSDVITGSGSADQITLTEDSDHAHIDWTLNGGTPYQLSITDPNGLTITDTGANTAITLNYTYGNRLPGILHLNGTFTINNLQGANPLAGVNLDLGRSTLFLAYDTALGDPLPLIVQSLQNGYNGGLWSGAPTPTTGVITSSAAAAAPSKFSIGYADWNDGTGANTTPNTVMLRYTVSADTNLDGTVNSIDAITM